MAAGDTLGYVVVDSETYQPIPYYVFSTVDDADQNLRSWSEKKFDGDQAHFLLAKLVEESRP